MNFYKSVCIIALIVLVVSLAFIGSALTSSTKNMDFPPNISKCPDGYEINYDESGNTSCKGTNNISGCDEEDFDSDSYNIPGIGPTSGACARKKWAQNCQVDWDGLTNNSQICHLTNI